MHPYVIGPGKCRLRNGVADYVLCRYFVSLYRVAPLSGAYTMSAFSLLRRSSRRSSTLCVAVSIALVALTGCSSNSPTGVASNDASDRPRRTEYVCVAPATGDTQAIVVPTEPDGTCQPGFEVIPWT